MALSLSLVRSVVRGVPLLRRCVLRRFSAKVDWGSLHAQNVVFGSATWADAQAEVARCTHSPQKALKFAKTLAQAGHTVDQQLASKLADSFCRGDSKFVTEGWRVVTRLLGAETPESSVLRPFVLACRKEQTPQLRSLLVDNLHPFSQSFNFSGDASLVMCLVEALGAFRLFPLLDRTLEHAFREGLLFPSPKLFTTLLSSAHVSAFKAQRWVDDLHELGLEPTPTHWAHLLSALAVAKQTPHDFTRTVHQLVEAGVPMGAAWLSPLKRACERGKKHQVQGGVEAILQALHASPIRLHSRMLVAVLRWARLVGSSQSRVLSLANRGWSCREVTESIAELEGLCELLNMAQREGRHREMARALATSTNVARVLNTGNRSDSLQFMQAAVRTLPELDVPTWLNTLLASAVNIDLAEQWGAQLLIRGEVPQEAAFAALLRHCAGDITLADTWFRLLLDMGAHPNETVFCALLDACLGPGGSLWAEGYMDHYRSLKLPDSSSLSLCLARSYASDGRAKEAQELLEAALAVGVPEEDVLFVRVELSSVSEAVDLVNSTHIKSPQKLFNTVARVVSAAKEPAEVVNLLWPALQRFPNAAASLVNGVRGSAHEGRVALALLQHEVKWTPLTARTVFHSAVAARDATLGLKALQTVPALLWPHDSLLVLLAMNHGAQTARKFARVCLEQCRSVGRWVPLSVTKTLVARLAEEGLYEDAVNLVETATRSPTEFECPTCEVRQLAKKARKRD